MDFNRRQLIVDGHLHLFLMCFSFSEVYTTIFYRETVEENNPPCVSHKFSPPWLGLSNWVAGWFPLNIAFFNLSPYTINNIHS